MSLKLKLFKTYYRIFSQISPEKAGISAFNRFQTTQNKNIRERELPFFQTATEFRVPFGNEDLYCYSLGNKNNPWILLVHGWDSNIGSMFAIAKELVQNNYYVIGLNLPAHGPSKLKKTNMEICHNAFLSLYDYLSPTKPISIVSHSFGSAVVSYSLSKRNLPINELIFLTCPNSIEQVFLDYSSQIGLTTLAHRHMVKLAEHILDEKVEHMVVSELIKTVKYKSLTIIHDEFDKVIPIADAKKISKSSANATLITMKNVGHYRMLWNPDLINKIIAQLNLNNPSEKEKELSLAAFY